MIILDYRPFAPIPEKCLTPDEYQQLIAEEHRRRLALEREFWFLQRWFKKNIATTNDDAWRETFLKFRQVTLELKRLKNRERRRTRLRPRQRRRKAREQARLGGE